MSPQFRQRVVRVAVVGLFVAAPLAAAPLVAAEPAAAEPVESGHQVTFSGAGVLGLTCTARPDVRSVTVVAETTVVVTNRTGHRARLLLDGVTQGELPDSASARVLFRRGPVTLSLRPNCVLGEESRTVRVEVTAPPTVDPVPVPSPPAPDPAAPGSAPPSGPGRTAGPGGGMAPTGAAQGGLPDAGGARPGRSAGSALPDGMARPRGAGAGPAGSGLPGRGVVTVPGMPPGDGAVLAPGAGAVSVPAPVGMAAAEPVAKLAPVTDTGRTGLLALIAAVCVLGVAAGAIRAFVAQRAFRTRMA